MRLTMGGLATFSALLALCFSMPVAPAQAHGGRLASDGCHNERSTGTRHCHRASASGAVTNRSDAPRGAYFPNCSAAHAAGVTPIRRGQPGYASHLDRDGDGVACER